MAGDLTLHETIDLVDVDPVMLSRMLDGTIPFEKDFADACIAALEQRKAEVRKRGYRALCCG